MKLLLSYGDTNLSQRVVAVRELVSFLGGILKSPATTEVFFYLLEHGGATAWLLQVELRMPEASVYRALRRLRRMDIIRRDLKIRHQRGAPGGPRATVWIIQGASLEQTGAAIRKHQRALSPKYRVAEEFVQGVLEPYMNRNADGQGLTFNQIVRLTRGYTKPYRNVDIADLAATILTEKGIRVWR